MVVSSQMVEKIKDMVQKTIAMKKYKKWDPKHS